MPSTPGEVYHGQEIPAGYAKVGVEEVCNDWKNLELDIPGGDGEIALGDAVQGYILWDKRYIILKPTDQGSRLASPQHARRSPPPPPSPGPASEHSAAEPPSPRQPLTTPAELPSLGSPPPSPQKKRKKTEPENQDKLLDPSKLNFFIGMKEANRRKFIEKPLSDYDRSIKKSYQKSKSRSSSSDVPQLGAQEKQSIQPLLVLNQEQQGFLGFLQSSRLTTDDITGASNWNLDPEKEYLIAPVVRWAYKEGTSLVPPEIVPLLPTQMQRLHDLYMKAMSDCNFMQGAKITDEDFFRGEAIIWIDWEEIYQLYHQDFLDISIVTLWLL